MNKLILIPFLLTILLISCQEQKNSIELFNEGNQLIKKKLFDKAKLNFEKSYKKDSTNIEALILQGYCEHELSNNKNALKILNNVLSINSSNSLAYTIRAEIKLFLQDIYGSLIDCNTAIKINKKNINAYYTRALIFVTNGKPLKAIEDYKTIMKLDNKEAKAFYECALLLLNQKKKSEACILLSLSGELGFMEAYEVIKENCNNNTSLLSNNNNLKKTIPNYTKWYKKKSNTGNFHIDFPSIPQYSNRKNIKEWTSKDKENQVTYKIIIMESPKKPTNPRKVIKDYLIPSLVEQDILISSNNSIYKNHLGVDFIYKSSTDKKGLYSKVRTFFIGKRIYILITQYYHSNLIDFKRFCNSFEYINVKKL